MSFVYGMNCHLEMYVMSNQFIYQRWLAFTFNSYICKSDHLILVTVAELFDSVELHAQVCTRFLPEKYGYHATSCPTADLKTNSLARLFQKMSVIIM